jgi:hypothetical protein
VVDEEEADEIFTAEDELDVKDGNVARRLERERERQALLPTAGAIPLSVRLA